jgi:cytoskeletal protein RodZ
MSRGARERYRVYSADEFLAEEFREEPSHAEVSAERRSRRRRGGRRQSAARQGSRFAGAALLVAVAGAVGALSWTSLLRSGPDRNRSRTAVVSASARVTGRRLRLATAMTTATTTAAEHSSRSDGTLSRVRPSRRTTERASVVRAALRRLQRSRAILRQTTWRARVPSLPAAPARPRSKTTRPVLTASATASTTASATAAAAPQRPAEFGFER